MSELRVAEIHNPNDQTGGITIDNDDNVSINGQALPTAGALGNRNLIINGAMQIAQRGDDVDDVTTTGFYTCDRFQFIPSIGTWTVQQSTESPDGFSNSLRMLCTTANASPASSDVAVISHVLEGFDSQRLLEDDTTTRPLIFSFWVKAIAAAETFPKTASIVFRQPENGERQFTTSYTIQASDTWERIVVPIPVDTAAAFNNDNGIGFRVDWWLNSGSDFNSGTHSTGWVPQDNTARNATNLGVGGTVNDEFCLTGVQLEVGTNATEFEWRPMATELALCQRYFCKSYNQEVEPGTNTVVGAHSLRNWGSTGRSSIPFNTRWPVTMRGNPSVTFFDLQGTQGAISEGNNALIHSTSVTVSTIVGEGMGGVAGGDLDANISALGFYSWHYTADTEI